MNETTLSPTAAIAEDTTAGATFYRLVWKWHFIASLYVLPFMLLLPATGTLYLYKPQIESWLYADRMHVEQGDARVSVESQIAALTAHSGVKRIRGITQHEDPTRSTVIEFDDTEKVRSLAWVNPYDATIIATAERDRTAMRMVRKLHGEILLGDVGTKFVELAAHWAIVMFITGLFLWWPRGQRTVSKAFQAPKGKGRSWWRETHIFMGFFAALLVMPIIISGLPWTDVFGGGLDYVQEQTGQKSKSLRFGGGAPNSTASEGTPIEFATAFDVAREQGLAAPYEMRPPKNEEGAFWVRSASKHRSEQTELVVDQYTGSVLARVDFADNPPLARALSYGISFHQGELYGRLNVIQNTIAALLAFALAITGFVTWWKRRPAGKLGVPVAPKASLSIGLIALILVLAFLLPLMGLSLLVALVLDQLIFKRLGWFRG